MKKLFTSLLLAASACVLFSSCGNMSLAKRHYSNGYYVDFGNNKTKAETKESEKTAQNVSVPATEPTINNELSAKTKTETAQVNTDNNKNDIQSAGKKLSDENPKVNTIKSFLKNIFQLKKALNKRSDSGGHSFLWKLVVFLLVLWLVLYLIGGLGDIIYLLLVVALILFILWLLGNL